MKTVHITNAWHPSSGGIRTFYRALLDAANAEGHELRIIVPAARDGVEDAGKHGRVYSVAAPRAPFSPSYRILYPHRALFPGSPIFRILRDERPDLVEICDKFTMNYLGGLLRTQRLPGMGFRPAVVGLSCERLHETFRNYAFGAALSRHLAPLYLRWLYFPMADHHIAVSSYVAQELREVSGGHKVERGVWIGSMGVDAATFSNAPRDPELRKELEARCGGGIEKRLLVYAGRMVREKNIPLLFQMMRRLAETGANEYRLLMVGSGDEMSAQQREAERTVPGLVHFLGHRAPASELARVLRCCDAFVHPNPAEPFGIAPLEAMAAGLPLVAPCRGGATEYANSSNAWLAEPEPEAFAAAVRAVFANPVETRVRAKAGQRAAAEREWSHAASHFLKLYREIHARVRSADTAGSLAPAFLSSRSV
jgi:glycosyltransferase involved in cell wall biosynthesis